MCTPELELPWFRSLTCLCVTNFHPCVCTCTVSDVDIIILYIDLNNAFAVQIKYVIFE